MDFFVLLWIDSGLKQRKEYVLQHLGKVRHELLCLENVAVTHKRKLCYILWGNLKTVCIYLCLFRPPHSLDSGHLNHPPHVGRVYFMVNEPLGQIVPLIRRATVDGKAWLCMLVLTLLQIVGDFLLRVRGTVCFEIWEMCCIPCGWLPFTKPLFKIK